MPTLQNPRRSRWAPVCWPPVSERNALLLLPAERFEQLRRFRPTRVCRPSQRRGVVRGIARVERGTVIHENANRFEISVPRGGVKRGVAFGAEARGVGRRADLG